MSEKFGTHKILNLKMYSSSCTNSHHDDTTFKVEEMVFKVEGISLCFTDDMTIQLTFSFTDLLYVNMKIPAFYPSYFIFYNY